MTLALNLNAFDILLRPLIVDVHSWTCQPGRSFIYLPDANAGVELDIMDVFNFAPDS